MDLVSLAKLERVHRRHDEIIAGLLAAARRLAAGRPQTGDVDAARGAVVYFERAVTRHFLDEEGSVFPRLSTRRPELAEAIAALSAEHPTQIALQQATAAAVDQLAGEPRLGAGKALLEVAEQLAAHHRAHVVREDDVLRAAHEALTEEDDAAIVAEMATRQDREVDDDDVALVKKAKRKAKAKQPAKAKAAKIAKAVKKPTKKKPAKKAKPAKPAKRATKKRR